MFMKKVNFILIKKNCFIAEFSSPNVGEFIPSQKFIDTEVINRYILMESLSSSKIYLCFIYILQILISVF